VRFDHAIDLYVADKRAANEIASKNTEDSYRYALGVLAADTSNRDPSKIGKRDLQRTLARWEKPRTRAQRHAIYRSFFEWALEEGLCAIDPARQVRKARFRAQPPVRLTAPEINSVRAAAAPVRRDRWAVEIMLHTGARNAELRGLHGSDLARDGVIRLHGKGDKTRWVPVLPALQPTVDEILATIAHDRYVLPGRRSSNPPHHTIQHDTQAMLSSSALQRQMHRIGARAGIGLRLHPHLLRHAFGDAVTRYAGARVAQTLMGHESVQTTVDTYVGAPSIEEMVAHLRGFTYGGLSAVNHPEGARDATDAR
jgi:site-specific recombinase XerD